MFFVERDVGLERLRQGEIHNGHLPSVIGKKRKEDDSPSLSLKRSTSRSNIKRLKTKHGNFHIGTRRKTTAGERRKRKTKRKSKRKRGGQKEKKQKKTKKRKHKKKRN